MSDTVTSFHKLIQEARKHNIEGYDRYAVVPSSSADAMIEYKGDEFQIYVVDLSDITNLKTLTVSVFIGSKLVTVGKYDNRTHQQIEWTLDNPSLCSKADELIHHFEEITRSKIEGY